MKTTRGTGVYCRCGCGLFLGWIESIARGDAWVLNKSTGQINLYPLDDIKSHDSFSDKLEDLL